MFICTRKKPNKWPEKFQTAATLNGTNISAEFRKPISVLDSLDNPVAPVSCTESVQSFGIDITKNKDEKYDCESLF